TATTVGASTVSSDAALERWLRENHGQDGRIVYRPSQFDLDGDGAPEELVYLAGPGRCGSGGCNLLVLKRQGDDFETIVNTTVTRLPVGVLDTDSNGWRDIWVTVGGGGLPSGRRALKFDG